MPGLSLIVNPSAGRGRALRILGQLAAALTSAAADYQVTESASLQHAVAMATDAAAAGRIIVAVGGDGTASALAGVAARHGTTFGIMPAGRGNDLARMLTIPADPAAVAALLAARPTRQIDLIGVSIPGQPEAIVAGTVYTGVPSVAGELANATRWLRAPAVYPLAALRAIMRWEPVGFRLTGTAGDHDFAGYAVVAANSAYFGAGMNVAPGALVDDGQLDVVLMRHAPKATFLRVLARIKEGTHLGLAEVSVLREPDVLLTLSRTMPVAADGETLPFAAPLPAGTPLRIRTLPAALTVIAPPADRPSWPS
jgi:diacylglycerol kinase (ATP)